MQALQRRKGRRLSHDATSSLNRLNNVPNLIHTAALSELIRQYGNDLLMPEASVGNIHVDDQLSPLIIF